MKKISLLLLSAVLLATSFAAPALAFEPSQLVKDDALTERDHGRRYYRRGRGRDTDWVGFGVGTALGILDAVTDDGPTYYQSTPQYYYPQSQPTLVYDPSCNCYYYR